MKHKHSTTDYHNHCCPKCLDVWSHDLWSCAIRDGSPEERCEQCKQFDDTVAKH